MPAMIEVNVHEAKTQLSKLLQRVIAGEEVIIARAGLPVAKLVPIEKPAKRLLGLDKGLFEVPADFDAPMPDEVLADFER
jgi:prevent-host-death family protein